METTNIINLDNRSEEQLDWVGDLTPTHLCITPDTPESNLHNPASPEFIAASMHEAGHLVVGVYGDPQTERGEA